MNMTTLNWMPKLHKNPYRERYNDGFSNWSTKELSITGSTCTWSFGVERKLHMCVLIVYCHWCNKNCIANLSLPKWGSNSVCPSSNYCFWLPLWYIPFLYLYWCCISNYHNGCVLIISDTSRHFCGFHSTFVVVICVQWFK